MAGRPLKALYENRSITFDPQTSVSSTTITVADNNLSVDDIVVYKVPNGGTSITNLVNGGVYYVVAKPAADQFRISSLKSGTAINMGTFGSSGQTHTFTTGFSGVKEMTDDEILGWFTPTVLGMLLGDVGALYGTVGDHAFYLNMALGSASPVTNETIRTYWYEKHRSSTVGTHPYGSDDDRLYKLIQKEANYGAGVALTTNTRYYKPVTYSYDSGTGTTRITQMTSQQLYDSLIRVTVNSVITGGRSSYFVGQSAPGTGTWVEVASFDDRYWASGGALTTTTFKLWRRTDSNIAVTNVRPLVTGVTAVSTNPGDLFEMTESMITGDEYNGLGYHYLVSEYIRTTGIGKYQFSLTMPTDPGTWMARGQFVDNVNDVIDQSYAQAFTTNYTTAYTTQYASAYTIQPVFTTAYTMAYTGSFASVFTLVYAQPYTATYSGVAGYTGAEQGALYTGPAGAGYTRVVAGSFTGYNFPRPFDDVFVGSTYTTVYTAGARYTSIIGYGSGTSYTSGPIYSRIVFFAGNDVQVNFQASYQAVYTGVASYQADIGLNFTTTFTAPAAFTGSASGTAVYIGNTVIPNQVYTNANPLNNARTQVYGQGSTVGFAGSYGIAIFSRAVPYTSATDGVISSYTSVQNYLAGYTRTPYTGTLTNGFTGTPDLNNMFTVVWSNALQTFTGSQFTGTYLGIAYYGFPNYTRIESGTTFGYTGNPNTYVPAVYGTYTLVNATSYAAVAYTGNFTGTYAGTLSYSSNLTNYIIAGVRESFTRAIYGGYTSPAYVTLFDVSFAGIYGGYTATSEPFTGSYTGAGPSYAGVYNSLVYTNLVYTRLYAYTATYTNNLNQFWSSRYTNVAYATPFTHNPGNFFVRIYWTGGSIYTEGPYVNIRTAAYNSGTTYTPTYAGIVAGTVISNFYTIANPRYTNDSYIYFADPASPSYSTLLVYGLYAYTLSDGRYVVFVGGYTNRISFVPANVTFTRTQVQYTRNYTTTDWDGLAATGAVSIYTSQKTGPTVGQYAGTVYTLAYANQYTSTYTRNFTAAYTQSYTTLYFYTQNYTNSFTKAYTQQYTGAFTSPTVQAPTVYTHPDSIAYTRTVVPYTNAGVVFTDGSGSIYTTSIVYTEGNTAYTGSSGTYIGPAIYTAAVSGYTGGSATYIWTLWVRTA